jgi:hypothetical protein
MCVAVKESGMEMKRPCPPCQNPPLKFLITIIIKAGKIIEDVLCEYGIKEKIQCTTEIIYPL